MKSELKVAEPSCCLTQFPDLQKNEIRSKHYHCIAQYFMPDWKYSIIVIPLKRFTIILLLQSIQIRVGDSTEKNNKDEIYYKRYELPISVETSKGFPLNINNRLYTLKLE